MPRGLERIVPTVEGVAAGQSLMMPATERACRDCGQVYVTEFRAKWVCDGCVAAYNKDGPFAHRDVIAEARLDAQLTEAGIHGRWKDRGRLDTFRPEDQPSAYTFALRFIEEWPRLLALGFSGGVGTGKTHLVTGIARRLLEDGRTVRYVHLPTMAWAMKTAEHWSQEAAAQTKPLYAADLVVLDDCGREKETPSLKEAMDALIDSRWVRQRPTILTTNLTVALLKGWLGEASNSRFTSEATIITMAEGDRRLQPVDDHDPY